MGERTPRGAYAAPGAPAQQQQQQQRGARPGAKVATPAMPLGPPPRLKGLTDPRLFLSGPDVRQVTGSARPDFDLSSRFNPIAAGDDWEWVEIVS